MEQQLNEKSKKLLTKASERISMLYVEKAKIEQSEYGVQIRQGSKVSEIPITTISCLILGPGTTITHRAVANIASAGCSICWMGMDQVVVFSVQTEVILAYKIWFIAVTCFLRANGG